MKNVRLVWLLPSALLLLAAYFLTAAVLYAENSLFHNGDWVAESANLQLGLAASDDFVQNRFSLAGNVLNLGAFGGYQTLLSRKPYALRKLEIEFSVPEDSYLDLVLSRTAERVEGVRVSRRADLVSAVFRGTPDGGITEARRIELPPDSQSEWRRLSLQWGSSSSGSTLDGVSFDGPLEPPEGVIGVHSGFRGARVKDIRIETRDRKQIYFTFDNQKARVKLFFVNFFLLILLAWGFSSITTRKNPRMKIAAWLAFGLLVTVCSGIWYAFDFFYYSRKLYASNKVVRINAVPRLDSAAEDLRVSFFRSWYRLAGVPPISPEEIRKIGYWGREYLWGYTYCHSAAGCRPSEVAFAVKMPERPKVPIRRLMFFGTSQTMGIGATDFEDSFFYRVHKGVAAGVEKGTILESLNYSRPAPSSKRLFDGYEKEIMEFQPDLVVVNIPESAVKGEFQQKMEYVFKLNRRQGISTIALAEGESFEVGRAAPLARIRETLETAARRYNVPVLPLNEFLNGSEIINSGNLWWDESHLTSYGQKRVAEWLTPVVLKGVLARGKARMRNDYYH